MSYGDDQKDGSERQDRSEEQDEADARYPRASREPHDALDLHDPRHRFAGPAARAAHGPHLTPDLPPAAEAPELPGEIRPRPEDSPVGRQAELPPPYGGM